jgi:multimeric flavodoxin WrbA
LFDADLRSIICIPVERIATRGEAACEGGQSVAKNVLILKGSPRREGNSAILADQVAAGAKEAGGQVESVYLHELDIQPCDACDTCQKGDIDCVIEDDMQELYPKVRAADAVVYASPIYWFSVSAQLKLFIDRCYAMADDEDAPADYGLAGKKIGVALTYGDVDPYSSGAVNAIRMFQDIFRFIPAEIVDIVYGEATDEGEIKENAEVMKRAFDLGTKLVSG